ncbi:MAG: sulfatase-like hydrolase/transferase, partial [Patescibacteria group bacterium]|nr:sulfatase-like hydrolase/transferase [Patescibacteria group bacterium]
PLYLTDVAKTMKQACHWLENNYKAEKFFLWIDGFDPHEPWDPPQSYIEKYYPDYKGNKPISPDYNFTNIYTADEIKYIRATYAAEVSLVDRWIGYLLNKIDELGLKDSTIFIHTSDHGFYLGEHDRVGKHRLHGAPWQLYEEVAHIPLLARIPGVAGGLRINSIVQPQDLMPSILDLCGAPVPETVQGKSWAPLLTGSREDLHPVAVSSGPLNAKLNLITTPITVTNKEWSLIFGHPDVPPELYHLSLDPGQSKNVVNNYPEIAKQLQEQVRELLVNLKTSEDKIKVIQFF